MVEQEVTINLRCTRNPKCHQYYICHTPQTHNCVSNLLEAFSLSFHYSELTDFPSFQINVLKDEIV